MNTITKHLLTSIISIALLTLFLANGYFISLLQSANALKISKDSTLMSQLPEQKEVLIVVENTKLEIAPGVKENMWTFNGTVPGPTLRFTQGDNVTINLINRSPEPHTLHLHGDHNAAADGVFEVVYPNSTYTYNFIAGKPGAFPYHCHALPTTLHMRMGMVGIMIIDPKEQVLEPAREYTFVLSEHDFVNPFTTSPKYYLMNGFFNQYLGNNSIPVIQDELVRLYIANMGSTIAYPFHIHGTIFDFYQSGLISNEPDQGQTVLVGPGDATIIEAKWNFPGGFLFHPHGIEEEGGSMGCFNVISNEEIVSGAKYNTACSWVQPDGSRDKIVIPELTPVTNNTGVSMVDWQYYLQKKLQDPIITQTLDTNNSNSLNVNSSDTASTSNNDINIVKIVKGSWNPGQTQNYVPKPIDVTSGSKVTWHNEDTQSHTVTSNTGLFNSGIFQSNNVFENKFSKPGTYNYHCFLHPWMKGEVIVK